MKLHGTHHMDIHGFEVCMALNTALPKSKKAYTALRKQVQEEFERTELGQLIKTLFVYDWFYIDSEVDGLLFLRLSYTSK